MMMIPKNNFDLFDDFFGEPMFRKPENRLMKTDIKEHEDKFVLDIDLPGYNKEDIKIDVTDGYLTVNAKMNNESEEKDKGKFVRRERFFGECSRSFYVGDDVESDDIKASFKNGILSLEIPKVDEEKKLPEKKYIEISD
jgi:HSP20 family molecular chaperone IbpA